MLLDDTSKQACSLPAAEPLASQLSAQQAPLALSFACTMLLSQQLGTREQAAGPADPPHRRPPIPWRAAHRRFQRLGMPPQHDASLLGERALVPSA